MKIVQFTAENIKKLKVVDITPTKDFIQITGKNGSGKTSVLDAIWWALVGGKAIQGKPIRTGEEKATIRLDLGEMVVTRKFTQAGTTLVVENAEGFRAPSPQAMLDALIGHLTFDPLEFSRMEAKRQFETLRHIVPLPIDLDKMAEDDKKDHEKRRDINRDIKTLEGQVASIVVPDDAPDEPVSVTELMSQLEEIDVFNTNIMDLTNKRDAGRASTMRHKKRIEELQREIDAINIKLDAEADEDDRLCGLILPLKDNVELKARIAGAEAINQAHQAKKRKGELNASIALKTKEAFDITGKIQARADSKVKAMKESNMPIDGLIFGDGEVLFNDIPFTQLCSAEQLRVSVAIAMAANPKLKIIRIKDGSLLDDDGLRMIQEAAQHHDYQMWVENVNVSGKVGIYMEDGEVAANNYDADLQEAK